MNRQLIGDGTWPWHAHVDGDDIVVWNGIATNFGGDDDPQDDGMTASGVVTRGNPDCKGVALPLRDRCPNTEGSPIPDVPWHTMVRVYCRETGQVIEAPLIDLGPAKHTGHAIDLTMATFEELGLDRSVGVMHVDYRILDGAKLAGL